MPFLRGRRKSKNDTSSSTRNGRKKKLEGKSSKKGKKSKEDWKNDISFSLPPLTLQLQDDGTWKHSRDDDGEYFEVNEQSKIDRLFRENETLKEKNNLLKLKVETLVEMIVRKNIEIKRLRGGKK